MSDITLPDNETINDYVVSALGEVDALNAGVYDWRTSMPYRDDDSDVIISNAVHCVKPLLTKVDALQADLAAALARAQAAEEKSEKLQAIILDMDQARRWGGQRMSDDAMDAFRRLESRIKAAMKLID